MRIGIRPQLTVAQTRTLLRAILRLFPIFPGQVLLDLFEGLRRERTTLDEKIAHITTALREASSLTDELERMVKDRTANLEVLRSEVERYSRLSEIEEEKARPLLMQVGNVFKEGQATERWVSLAINLLAGILVFLLGVVVSPMLTRWLGIR
jgi:hypothetical protein